MRRSLFQKLLWGVLLLAAIELALLNFLGLDSARRRTCAGAWLWRPWRRRWRLLAGAFLFSRRPRRRIGRLKVFVEGLVAGPAQIPPPGSPDELGALAESLGRVAAQVNELVDKVRLEGARRDAILTGMVEGVLAVDQRTARDLLQCRVCHRIRRAPARCRRVCRCCGWCAIRIFWRCCAWWSPRESP
jgi:HAMP domain-containing protein